jgi:hypothetical protein
MSDFLPIAELTSTLSRRTEQLETVERPGFFVPFVALAGAEPYAADAALYRAVVGRNLNLRRWWVAVSVDTTNDGTNYWTLRLSAPLAGVLASVNTSAIAPDTWTTLTTATFALSAILAATEPYLLIESIATGTPGALSLAPGLYAT